MKKIMKAILAIVATICLMVYAGFTANAQGWTTPAAPPGWEQKPSLYKFLAFECDSIAMLKANGENMFYVNAADAPNGVPGITVFLGLSCDGASYNFNAVKATGFWQDLEAWASKPCPVNDIPPPPPPASTECDTCEYYLTIDRNANDRIVGVHTNVREGVIGVAKNIDDCCNECDEGTKETVQTTATEEPDSTNEVARVEEKEVKEVDEQFKRFGIIAGHTLESGSTFGGVVYRLPITSNNRFFAYGGGVLGQTIPFEQDITFDPTSFGKVETRRHRFVGVTIGTQYNFGKHWTVGIHGLGWGIDKDDFAAGPYAGYRNQNFQIDLGYLVGEELRGLNLNLRYAFDFRRKQ